MSLSAEMEVVDSPLHAQKAHELKLFGGFVVIADHHERVPCVKEQETISLSLNKVLKHKVVQTLSLFFARLFESQDPLSVKPVQDLADAIGH